MTLPDAVLTLLRAVPNLNVYDGDVPEDASLPYVVAFFGEMLIDSTSFDGVTNWREASIQTSCVGSTAEQVRLVASRVEDALLDVRPDVTGSVTTPIRKTVSVAPRADRDVTPAVIVGVDRWSVSLAPA